MRVEEGPRFNNKPASRGQSTALGERIRVDGLWGTDKQENLVDEA